MKCLVVRGVFEGTALTAAKLSVGWGTPKPLHSSSCGLLRMVLAQVIPWTVPSHCLGELLTGKGKTPAREYASNYALHKAGGPSNAQLHCLALFPLTVLICPVLYRMSSRNIMGLGYKQFSYLQFFPVPHIFVLLSPERDHVSIATSAQSVVYLLSVNGYYYVGPFSLEQLSCPCCLEAFL